jgi:ornithine cyclodeaminase/alanine dehydrogenase-like protein (mu-crystallin family)
MNNYSADVIGTAAPIERWVSAMEQAFVDTARSIVEVPQRMHLELGENTLLVMPCFGSDYFCTKLVSVFPENLKKKEPVIYGSVLLNDALTGKPLAVLDGSKLTAMRTAAVGAVAIKYLAPENAGTLGIVGLGIQGFHQALFACHQRRIHTIRIIDRSREVMMRFSERFNAFYPKIKVIPCTGARELCIASDIIITATGSHHPVVSARGKWWQGKTILGIGSYKPEMKEFPVSLLGELEQVFVDTPVALSESGDLAEPLKKGLLHNSEVIPLWDVILDHVKVTEDTRFFKSVGMAAFDLYGAKLVYESLT